RAHAHGVSAHVDDEYFWDKDGKGFPVEYSAKPIEANGAVVGAVVTFRDITMRREAEALVQEKMAELEKFTRVAVGRELRMIALKEEVNQLSAELGRERPYKIVE
ncbi:MAG: PAS domain S-box protein, partial [Magnetococcales bacterium]|nr:PAS domain S-box protein [Magnetococcales bacterium]